MHEPTAWSPRLGAITDTQFAAATRRAGAGGFIRAAPVTAGLFGQNVFLTTTRGEYVLRGAPHWVRWRREAGWRQHRPDAVVVPELLALYVVNDRLKLWAWFTQPDARAPWTRGQSFRAWAGRYHDALRVATDG